MFHFTRAGEGNAWSRCSISSVSTKTKTSRPLPAALAKRAALAGERKLRALAKAARDDIALIKRRKADIEDAFYDIGEALERLQKPGVLAALGVQKPFFAYVAEDLGISRETAARLLAIVRSVSRADALGMGGQRKVAAFIDLAKATPTPRDTPTSLVRRSVTAPSGLVVSKKSSSREIERAAASFRSASPKKTKRGNTVDPKVRSLGTAAEKQLHAAGVTKARLEIRASGPGHEPHVRIDQVPLSQLGALAIVLSKLAKRVPQSP